MAKRFVDILPPGRINKKIKLSRKSNIFQPSFSVIKTAIAKIVAILIIIALNWTGLSAIGRTAAYFNDIENSNANNYEAGTLDFYLSSPTGNFIPPGVVINMMPGNSVTQEISVINATSSNPFQYVASTTKTGGDDDFCNALDLEAKLDGVPQYFGKLMNFVSANTTFSTSTDDWFFKVTLPSGTSFPPGKVCQIKFVFDGWQINLPDYSSGFSDQEEIASSFATGGMKINKVYYDVDAGHGLEYANEWIEIYNPLDTPVDISGWMIVDNNATDTIPTSNPIPAKGFAIITASSTTWNYWNILDEVVKIILPNGKIGNGLANNGDRVILKMPDGTEDDAMSYGTDNYAFSPSCPDVTEGNMLGRSPNGYDTNQSSDFIEFGPPIVNLVYPVGGESWHSGQNVTLKWTAHNPSGPDNDLLIDIFYITDNDYSGCTITSGDNIYHIADSVANSGSFRWSVNPGFWGCVWIKVVASNSNNFMANALKTSNPIWEPPLDGEDSGLTFPPYPPEILAMFGITANQETPVIEEIITISSEATTTPTVAVEAATTTETVVSEATITSTATATENSTSIEEVIIEPIVENMSTTTGQTPPEETIIIIEEQPAIEEQPVVVEEPITLEPPVPPPADPPAPTE